MLVAETMPIKWRLKEVMLAKKLSVNELAERLGMHPVSVTRLRKHDEMPRIDGETLDKLCRALNCNLLDLIQRTSEPGDGITLGEVLITELNRKPANESEAEFIASFLAEFLKKRVGGSGDE